MGAVEAVRGLALRAATDPIRYPIMSSPGLIKAVSTSRSARCNHKVCGSCFFCTFDTSHVKFLDTIQGQEISQTHALPENVPDVVLAISDKRVET